MEGLPPLISFPTLMIFSWQEQQEVQGVLLQAGGGRPASQVEADISSSFSLPPAGPARRSCLTRFTRRGWSGTSGSPGA